MFQLFMKQELRQDDPQLPKLREVAPLYTDNIQTPARWPDYLFGKVAQPSVSRFNETLLTRT